MTTPPPPFLSAADYGLDPSKTDATNTSALNEAIHAAQEQGGGIVLIPPGTYLITGTVSVTASGVTLQGANQHATVLQFDNGSSNCVVIGGQTGTVYGVQISQMTLRGDSKTGGDLLHATNVGNMIIRDVAMADGYNGFYHDTSNNVLLSNVTINLSHPGGSYGIKWYSTAEEATPSHVTTLDSVIVNCNLTGADGMIVDGYCHTLRIKSMGILRSRHGLHIRNTQQSDRYFPQFLFCDNLEVDGVQAQALRIDGGRQFRFNNSDFFNHYAEDASDTDCIHITADANASVTSAIWFSSCRIAGAQQRGLYSECKNLTIANCYIGNNSRAGLGRHPAIELGGAGVNGVSNSTRIVGCAIGANFGDFGNQSYGVVANALVSRVAVLGCDFGHCAVAAILDNTGGHGNIAWRACFDINGSALPDNIAIVAVDPAHPAEGSLWESRASGTAKLALRGKIVPIATYRP